MNNINACRVLLNMVTLFEILSIIAGTPSERNLFNDKSIPALYFFHHFQLAITDDLDQTAYDMERSYGKGVIYAFSLDNYQQGYELAVAFYKHVIGLAPKMNNHQQAQFACGKQLYLAFHVLPVNPQYN